MKHGQSFKTMAITINGNGTLTGVSVGGLPDGIVDTDMLAANAVTTAKRTSPSGVTDIDAWALSANYDASSGSNIISSNWYQFSTTSGVNFPKLGSSMSHSSGVFTFPSTGIWVVDFILGAWNSSNNSGSYFGALLRYSTDSGSSYATKYSSYSNNSGNSDHTQAWLRGYLDVENTSTARVKFHTNIAAAKNIFGDADEFRTGAIFTRIGDT